MKKFKFFLVIFTCFIMTGAMAQLTYGPKLGINLATLSGSDAGDTKTLVAFNIGAVGNYALTDMFGVQAEILFDKKGTKYEGQDAQGNSATIPVSLGYITIPIMGVVNYPVNENIGVYGVLGPTISLLTSAKHDGKKELTYTDYIYDPTQPWIPPMEVEVTEKFKDYYKGSDIGLVVGAGAAIPISGVVVKPDIRYNFGFGTIHSDDGEGEETIKNSVISINIAVMFGGPVAASN